ncbi:MAG: acyl-CoA desaturase, partial [Coxiella-like endosymbiont]
MIKNNKINWSNTLFIILTTIGGIAGTQILIVFGLIRWPTWILAAGMFIVCGLSVTAGYHRLAAHRSYRAIWPVRFFFALFGAAAFEGSVLEWVTDHRNHHRYTDTNQDPYNIKKGFWYAHIGWLFTLDPSKRDFSNVQDLLTDPIYRFQHRFFPVIAVIMGFGLPMAIGALWGDPLGGLIVAGTLRIAFLHQSTFFINSLCHMFGKRTYKGSSAKDNWVTALLTFGEGFHNFHHQFPIDYRNGVRFFHFDPTKWLIYLLSRIGFASDLKRVERCRMIKYRLHIDTRRLAFISEEITKIVVKPIYERIHHLLA